MKICNYILLCKRRYQSVVYIYCSSWSLKCSPVRNSGIQLVWNTTERKLIAFLTIVCELSSCKHLRTKMPCKRVKENLITVGDLRRQVCQILWCVLLLLLCLICLVSVVIKWTNASSISTQTYSCNNDEKLIFLNVSFKF